MGLMSAVVRMVRGERCAWAISLAERKRGEPVRARRRWARWWSIVGAWVSARKRLKTMQIGPASWGGGRDVSAWLLRQNGILRCGPVGVFARVSAAELTQRISRSDQRHPSAVTAKPETKGPRAGPP